MGIQIQLYLLATNLQRGKQNFGNITADLFDYYNFDFDCDREGKTTCKSIESNTRRNVGEMI